jgi:hypothetical protein
MLPQGPLHCLHCPFRKAVWLGVVGCRHSVVNLGFVQHGYKTLELGSLVCEHLSSAAKFGKHVLHERSCGDGCCFVRNWYHH